MGVQVPLSAPFSTTYEAPLNPAHNMRLLAALAEAGWHQNVFCDWTMMRRGYSRDHRPDCEQFVIALIVNSKGSRSATRHSTAAGRTFQRLRRFYAWWNANAAGRGAFGSSIAAWSAKRICKRSGGAADSIWWGTPRSQMKQFEEELLKEEWIQVRPEAEAKAVAFRGQGDLHSVPDGGPERRLAGRCATPYTPPPPGTTPAAAP